MTEASPPGVELRRLRAFLDRALPRPTVGPLTAELIAGGRSNLTYVVTDGVSEWVLRRPPLGHVLATAHDMAREYRVMTALADTRVPVPATYLLAEQAEGADAPGAPFYLMEKVTGTVYRTAEQTADLGAAWAVAISHDLIDVLAALHRLDPVRVGLGDFGRPDGFLDRQVRRWQKQLAASRSRDIAGIDELSATLANSIPATQRPAIVHGDYKLDNVIISADSVAAVVDWEMATLGDPLCDVGLFNVYWDRSVEVVSAVSPISAAAGFPPAAELLDRYAAASGLDLSPLPWYEALGCFKLAVISEGIHYRYLQGKTVGDGFEVIGDMVAPLVAGGLARLAER
jgi:aminoglycoside phosphotransferase (APT) family kinase protein